MNGPNRDIMIELLTGSYSVTSCCSRSAGPVGTNQPSGRSYPSAWEILAMEVTAGSHLGWFSKWSVATNREHLGRGTLDDLGRRYPHSAASRLSSWKPKAFWGLG
jgi:hypothetical protein